MSKKGRWSLEPYVIRKIMVMKASSPKTSNRLEQYMFHEYQDKAERAKQTANYFADHETHQSHSLGIDREQARDHGFVIDDLEANQDLQDAVLTVHHATIHTLQGPAVKIVESHLGRISANCGHLALRDFSRLLRRVP